MGLRHLQPAAACTIAWLLFPVKLEDLMACRLCRSRNQNSFPCEVNIHFPGLKNLTKTVWTFPELRVCADCGFAEFRLQEAELRLLEQGTDARAAAA